MTEEHTEIRGTRSGDLPPRASTAAGILRLEDMASRSFLLAVAPAVFLVAWSIVERIVLPLLRIPGR